MGDVTLEEIVGPAGGGVGGAGLGRDETRSKAGAESSRGGGGRL